MYELHDRGAGQNIGRFRTLREALSFIEICVPSARVLHLILGRQDESGEYVIVSDGYDLRNRLLAA